MDVMESNITKEVVDYTDQMDAINTQISNFKPQITKGTDSYLVKCRVWEAVQSKLADYSSHLTILSKLGTSIDETIVAAVDDISSFVGDNSEEMNTALLPSIRESRSKCERDLNTYRSLYSKARNQTSNDVFNEASNKIKIGLYGSYISVYETLLTKLDEQIIKLEELKSKEDAAISAISDLLAEIKAEQTAISEITPSSTASYQACNWG